MAVQSVLVQEPVDYTAVQLVEMSVRYFDAEPSGAVVAVYYYYEVVEMGLGNY